MQGHVGKHQGPPGGRKGEDNAWEGGFTVVSMGKDKVSQGKQLRIG